MKQTITDNYFTYEEDRSGKNVYIIKPLIATLPLFRQLLSFCDGNKEYTLSECCMFIYMAANPDIYTGMSLNDKSRSVKSVIGVPANWDIPEIVEMITDRILKDNQSASSRVLEVFSNLLLDFVETFDRMRIANKRISDNLEQFERDMISEGINLSDVDNEDAKKKTTQYRALRLELEKSISSLIKNAKELPAAITNIEDFKAKYNKTISENKKSKHRTKYDN
jgi:hypothetical protein